MALDIPELLIIAVIIVIFLVLGPKKIPELARSLGSARKEFETSSKSGSSAPPADASVSGDELLMAARRLGISTEGKSKEQIQAEIIRKTAGA